eukprot:CAMPEP_0183785014 /NCGR_PEP_ID=MMETSP0739-20130205/66286_1 /TAXON_ID=385413 /ORGANISM="Thalassiosira miniscula, Strain CCMP1093" /LENGTH=151 /DNA_ID=CAMNT_0026029007 /DNA_START=538 /DNA_END=989 /DNA_ORIENTATION=+
MAATPCYSSDEEEELGALIYKSSLTARARARAFARDSTMCKPIQLEDRTQAAKTPGNGNGLIRKKRGHQHQSVDGKIGSAGKRCARKRIRPQRIAKKCKHKGCTKFLQSRGLCWKHGAKAARKLCSHQGCTNYSIRVGVCIRHGAKLKQNA